MLRNLYYLIFLLLFVVSCTNTRKIASIMQQEIGKIKNENYGIDSNYLFLSYGKLDTTIGDVHVEKIKSKLIPAIFYWHNSSSYKISINDSIVQLLFSKYFYAYADSLQLKQLLLNTKLLVHVPTLSNSFEYDIVTNTSVPLLYVMYSKNQLIKSETDSIAANYFIFYQNKKAAYGEMMYKNDTTFQKQSKPVSTKNYLKQYIQYYTQTISSFAKSIVDRCALLLNQKED